MFSPVQGTIFRRHLYILNIIKRKIIKVGKRLDTASYGE